MKQKLVIKVQMNCEKCRTKAKKIVAGENGVSSLALEQSEGEIVVTGEGFDSVKLAGKLRRKVGHAVIVSLQQEKEETTREDDKNKQEDKTQILIPSPWSSYSYIGYPQAPPIYEVLSDPNPSLRSIL